MTTRITIEAVSIGHRGQRYRVTHAERVLIESTREPLFDACRALLAQGVAGRLEMWRPGKAHPDMSADIERGAALTVAETAEIGPVIRPWRSFHRETDEPAFPDVPSEAGMAAPALSVSRCPKKFRPSTTRFAA